MPDRIIYADNAATTRLSEAALAAMTPYLTGQYGNPSSLYSFGQQSRQAVERARHTVAEALGCAPREVFFTSGGSESDNWALKMGAALMKSRGKTHLISTAFEHHAVLHTLKQLERDSSPRAADSSPRAADRFTVTLLPVYENGVVRPADLAEAITPQTGLVSVMFANNEIGTIQPIAEIGAICRAAGVLFHTDAVQAAGHIPIDFKGMQIDLLSLSGHKFHGPKGVGGLLIRNGLRLDNLIAGGAQEGGRRAGTENVAGVAGMAAALAEAAGTMAADAEKMSRQRDRLIREIQAAIPRCRLNGDPVLRLPNNVNMSFEGIEGESLLLRLDYVDKICASTGSACTTNSLVPSHVLMAIGLPVEVSHGSLRLSLSAETTDEEIDHIIKVLPGHVDWLREKSPLWENICRNEGI